MVRSLLAPAAVAMIGKKMKTWLSGAAPGARTWGAIRWAAAAAVTALLVACGGGDGGAAGGDPVPEKPASRAEAARFLTQATFGPTDAQVDRVIELGYSAWIDEQFTQPRASHRLAWEAADASLKASGAAGAWHDEVLNSFWKQAITGPDPLRQRVAYALSQIFVVSLQDDAVGANPRGVAAYLDLLADHAFGNYRGLLESVSLHPVMGSYLTFMRSQKADAVTGRVPDENYAREVMQLFSIGLLELNIDGSLKRIGGQPIETYSAADVAGLAKVFTGWSWSCPAWPDNGCFHSGAVAGVSDPDRGIKPMQGYPQYHSADEKSFLQVSIAAQAPGDPAGDLKVALDALSGHPNVGPFFGKQLIQRLVTSNPSPAYVAAVASAFADNGSGVRGDLKAVVKAVLMHPEARVMSNTSGKLREPVLKLSAFLRAFPFTSDTGNFRIGNTDNPATHLGQTPMRSPSVFNFYRPGYVPPGTQAAAAELAAPEMQIAHETSAAGYVNYMRDSIASGVGQFNGTVNGTAYNRRDLQPDFSAELALADKPSELLDRLNGKLMYGTMPAALKGEIQGAIEKIAIPALNGTGSNQTQVDAAKRRRVNAALLLTLVSPEYQVQR